MADSPSYPIGLQILLGEDKARNPRALYYTLLVESSGPEDLQTQASDLAGPLLHHIDWWPMDNPAYLGIVDLYYAGAPTIKKGTVFSRHTFPCKDQEDALNGVQTLDIEFPIWTLSPLFLIESFHFFPAYPRDGQPRLRVVHGILGKFDLQSGFPLKSEIERMLKAPAFTRQVCMPFATKKKNAPELLDWRIITTEEVEQNPDSRFVYAAPWEFRTRSELQRELLTSEEIHLGYQEVLNAWHEFEHNTESPSGR
jgi:hypothetical protein